VHRDVAYPDAMTQRAQPELLIEPAVLAARLGEEQLRVLDATVHLRRAQAGAPYRVESGRADYELGHIPGAAFADIAGALSDPDSPYSFTVPPLERFAAAAGALGIAADSDVVVYSQHSPMWATRLWWLLRYFGFERVSVLDGGLPAWVAAGLALAQGDETYPPAELLARPRPEMLADRREVERIVAGEGRACLINALSPEAFRGEGPGAYARPGRIPGSVNAHWENVIDPETGRFRAPAELARRLGSLGSPGSEPVIAYCGGGISATVDLFALALIGRDGARLYDGSLTEWSADASLPLETG
jgi:thiosulfate/3-mercaptopyruvate sulfurtransferase